VIVYSVQWVEDRRTGDQTTATPANYGRSRDMFFSHRSDVSCYEVNTWQNDQISIRQPPRVS